MDRFDDPTQKKPPELSRRQLLGWVGGGVAGAMLASLGLPALPSYAATPDPTSLRSLLRRISAYGCDPSRGIRVALPDDHPSVSIRDVARQNVDKIQDLCAGVPDTTKRFHVDVTTQDCAPIGGTVDIALSPNGDFTFSGHIHNSGFVDIHYALGALITTPSASGDTSNGYPFAHPGAVDGTSTLLGRNRDDDWSITGNKPEIAAHWGEITQGGLSWRLVAQDTLSAGIEGLIEDIGKDAIKALAKAAVDYLIKAVVA